MTKKTPHVHAEVIKAWADGAEIECKQINDDRWAAIICTPNWHPNWEYRIKPAAPETRMTDQELIAARGMMRYEREAIEPNSEYAKRLRGIANAAIARALADGDVVLPNDR